MRGQNILVVFILLSFQAVCQNDSTEIISLYEKETIYLFGNKYIKNEVKHPIRELVNEFTENTEANLLFQSYRKDHRKGNVYFAATMVLTLFAAPLVDEDVGLGALTVGIISGVVTISLFGRAENKLKKAIWLRNRDVLIRD